MGLFDFLRPARRAAKSSTWEIFRDIYGAPTVKSGAKVNYATSLEVTTVLRAAGVIAESLSTVPCKLFRADGNTRVEATEHPLAELLSGPVNEFQNWLELREQLGLHLALVRNAFVVPVRVDRGRRIVELIALEPQWVEVKRNADYSLTYTVRPPGVEPRTFSQADIWHIRAFPNWSGFFASEVVMLAREAIGLAMATEEAHARMHTNAARVGGLYSIEGTLDADQHKRLTEWLKAAVGGVEHTGTPLVLDRNAKFTPSQMTGVDSEHLETRRFQIEEICRSIGVLPIMVGHYDKAATFASAEQMFLAHAVHYVRPWHRRFEASANIALLSEGDRKGGHYFKFLDAELLRGAATTRADYYGKGIKDGWLTRNEARGFEELNPLDGLDVPLMPRTMSDGTEPPPANDPAGGAPPAPAP